ncbi:MAG: DUF4390 domain-containing protein [Desulfurivibrio sp.]|nr:DUF4390 domain-containing protein [Desulfurivibrio sp.]
MDNSLAIDKPWGQKNPLLIILAGLAGVLRPAPGYRWLLAAVVLLVASVPQGGRAATEARIADLVVANSHQELLLYFELQNALTPEMEEGLKSGLPLAFTFQVELKRQRAGWLDQKLARREFEHRLSYDNLKDEYRVLRQEQQEESRGTASLSEAKRWLTRVDGLALLPLAQLTPGESYQVRVRARLAKKDLPTDFQRLLSVGELWGFETAWQVVEFSY